MWNKHERYKYRKAYVYIVIHYATMILIQLL